jgi:hypothetical protein
LVNVRNSQVNEGDLEFDDDEMTGDEWVLIDNGQREIEK